MAWRSVAGAAVFAASATFHLFGLWALSSPGPTQVGIALALMTAGMVPLQLVLLLRNLEGGGPW